ncbi:MAG: AAA family ATPase [Candidatus Binataceae bacterium]
MEEKRIILIGGAPTTGKSTVADQVAKQFGVPWISTDQMRKIMRKVANRADHPKLFNPEGYSVERFLTEFSAQQMLQIQLEQGEAVWTVAQAFIREDWMWTKGFVVEGIHILPHLVARDFRDGERLKAVFLVDEDTDRMRRVIYTRGLSGDAKTYSDDVKEKEVELVTLFNHWLKAEVERFGFPLVQVKKDGNDLQVVLAAISG